MSIGPVLVAEGVLPYGQDVSVNGVTIISWTTDAFGCANAKAITPATFAGSFKFFGSGLIGRSGRSKNSVSMPPGMIAVARTLWARPSVPSARVKPTRPHFEAQYALAFGQARTAAVEATLTM